MDICTDLNSISYFNQSVITIGVFDGLHCGHIAIIKDLKSRAEYKGIPAIVVTFDPHPQTILNEEDKHIGKLLMCKDEKLKLFKKHGIDYVWLIPFDYNFSLITL